MIYVSLKRKNTHITRFVLSGHADSGPYGYDLVCAAVSAVSFGSVNAAMSLSGYELNIIQGNRGGYLQVMVPDDIPDQAFEKVQLLLEGMLVSLRTIEQDNREFICITEE